MRRLLAGVNWKAFAVLLAAGLLGVVAVLPFMMELVGRNIFGQAAASDVPMPLILALALLQNGVLLAVTILNLCGGRGPHTSGMIIPLSAYL